MQGCLKGNLLSTTDKGSCRNTDGGQKALAGIVVSRCDDRIFDKQYNIPVILFFTLGIMHKKLIFIYIMIPNVWDKSI